MIDAVIGDILLYWQRFNRRDGKACDQNTRYNSPRAKHPIKLIRYRKGAARYMLKYSRGDWTFVTPPKYKLFRNSNLDVINIKDRQRRGLLGLKQRPKNRGS
jgi:hypothetical protein